MGVLGDGECISFGGLSEIKVFLECRNAGGSVFGDGGVFLLRDYLESRTFQNAEVSVFGNEGILFLKDYLKTKTF